VRADRQVLICPACQASVNWMAELDRCPACESAHLVRRLGEVECRDCGYVREPVSVEDVDLVPCGEDSDMAGTGAEPGLAGTASLAEEVELALARVLGRAGRPARIG
jgi:Zn finger protein HypA/HybF involved in hydrogenase expression